TLRANRITGLRRYYGLIRPCATHRDLVLVGLPLGPSLGIVTTGSHVLRESPNQAHATFTPVTVKAVSRFRLDFIPGQRLEPGFDGSSGSSRREFDTDPSCCVVTHL